MVTYRGISIYLKENPNHSVLRDLMQIHKTQCPRGPFAFIASDSLLPGLTLWENLKLATNGDTWAEILNTSGTEVSALMRLIKNPDTLSSSAQPWERFIISLVKGLKSKGNLLIDMKEDELTPLMVMLLKRMFVRIERDIILASQISSLWLDCSHRIYSKKEYKIHIEELNCELVSKHWVA